MSYLHGYGVCIQEEYVVLGIGQTRFLVNQALIRRISFVGYGVLVRNQQSSNIFVLAPIYAPFSLSSQNTPELLHLSTLNQHQQQEELRSHTDSSQEPLRYERSDSAVAALQEASEAYLVGVREGILLLVQISLKVAEDNSDHGLQTLGSGRRTFLHCRGVRTYIWKKMFCEVDLEKFPTVLRKRNHINCPLYEADNDQPTLISKLDLSSSLHLHPNDSATLTVISVKLKGTENYQVWSCAMLFALEGKNKTGFIDGSCRRSNTDEVLGRQWDKVNVVVLGWILNSISEELLNAPGNSFDALFNCHEGSNGSASESERAATSDHNTTLSEDDVVVDDTTEHVHILNNQPLRRSERASVFPNIYNDYVVDSKVKYGLEKYVGYSNLTSEFFCFTTELNKAFEPKNYWESCKDQHWIEAMNKEMDALYRNDTWEICDLPKDRKSIGGKWVFKIKYKSNGEIERYKARYVVKGYNQKEGIDFDETFSPVVKIVTLDETVYMDLPEGFYSPDDKRVCKLKKSLYGLKQAPRQWNAKLTQTLVECGFKQSKSDYSLFTKSGKGNFLALLVYVDDIIVTGNNVLETDLGLCLSQRKYCLDLLSEYGLLACKPSATPLEQNLAICNEPTEVDKILDNITQYQRLIRKLIYLTHTRPDISYSVYCLSQFMHKPLRSHIRIALKVLRYLKSNPGKGIHIVRQPKASLEAFVDADWAKCLATRKSVTGFCVKLNGSLIS
ncbi:ribonuclease H-like domain-containing protein [Tanacetum coccineum]|uniref:Ribonuclease H-like domain-containing protein n=1 Tax=Tanacetum coccineum TaxID=301880 RepID=A0ABQ5GTI8_9ASTR